MSTNNLVFTVPIIRSTSTRHKDRTYNVLYKNVVFICCFFGSKIENRV